MSQPPEQGSGHGQDDWGTVPSSGASGSPQGGSPEESGLNLRKGEQGQNPDHAQTQYAPTYQPPSDAQHPYGQTPSGQDSYGENPYGLPGQDPYGQNPFGSAPAGYGAPDPYAQPPGTGYDPYQAAQAPAYGSSAYGVQNPYGAAPYGGYVYGTAQQSTNGKAIGALICGIVALVMVAACWPLSFPLGIAGIVLGFMSRKEVDQSGGAQTGSGMGLAGIITGALGIVGAVIWTVLFIVLIAAGSSMDSVYYY